MTVRLLVGDASTMLRTLPDASARCCVTSPPYWGLRDYGVPGQLGLESSPDDYVARLVDVFREVRRVLTGDGTLWLNLGDTYSSGGRTSQKVDSARAPAVRSSAHDAASGKQQYLNGTAVRAPVVHGPGSKQLLMMPARVAIALQQDGWSLRSDIIWAKPNPMPESVRDRPTASHEHLFLLSRSPRRYYYDADAIAEPCTCDRERGPGPMSPAGAGRNDATVQGDYRRRYPTPAGWDTGPGSHHDKVGRYHSGNAVRDVPSDADGRGITNDHRGRGVPWEGTTRNARSVWTIPTQPYPGSHFATFPDELARRCIVAGSAAGDTVLDPFAGSGTVGAIAVGNARRAVLCELNPRYAALIRDRVGPMLMEGER